MITDSQLERYFSELEKQVTDKERVLLCRIFIDLRYHGVDDAISTMQDKAA